MVCLATLAPAATAADAKGFALLKRSLDGREPALPEGCVLDVELEAKELLLRFLLAGRAAVEEAYRGIRAELGRRPTPTELLHLLPSPPAAARYTTHVAVYDLTAAAGFWGQESVPEDIDWTEVPGVSLKPDMFVARVTGTSMEPLIPDGSWCLFRPCPAGSREGRIVLVLAHDSLSGSCFNHWPNDLQHLFDLRPPVNEVPEKHGLPLRVPINPAGLPVAQQVKHFCQFTGVPVDVTD